LRGPEANKNGAGPAICLDPVGTSLDQRRIHPLRGEFA